MSQDPHRRTTASMTTETPPGPGASRASAALVLLGSFVLGMIAGAALLHIVRLSIGRPPGGPPPGRPIVHLQRELGLSSEQVKQLRAILDASRERLHSE